MSELLSSITGGGGGLTMPQQVVREEELFVKTAINASAQSQTAAFYTAVEGDFTDSEWDTATLQPVSDTTEQTLISIPSGSGVLTQVKSTVLVSGPSTMTIRVTADSELTTFIATLRTNDTLILGDFISTHVTTTNTQSTALGGGLDDGYNVSLQHKFLTTPPQAIERGLHGIVFKSSLLVTCQGSSAVISSATNQKGFAAVKLTIPKGL